MGADWARYFGLDTRSRSKERRISHLELSRLSYATIAHANAFLVVLAFSRSVSIPRIASLDYGDGRWVTQWFTYVFHTGLFGAAQRLTCGMVMAPVPVTTLKCNCDTYECTANLDYGDGHWVAQWPTAAFHTGAFVNGRKADHDIETTAPVTVKTLKCDSDS